LSYLLKSTFLFSFLWESKSSVCLTESKTEGRWSDRGHLIFFTPARKAPLHHILSKHSELRVILCVCGQFYRLCVGGRKNREKQSVWWTVCRGVCV